jgi:hypothetical protein
MDVILNERQYKKILFESVKQDVKNNLDENNTILKNVVKKVKTNFDLDLKFILTYSVTISGLIGPVFKLVSGEIPTLSNENISLITAGTILTFYYSNTELLHKILILIRNNNLINEFNVMLSKTEYLKNVFEDFINSLKITIGGLSNILSFTFFLSILNVFTKLSNNAISETEIKTLIFGITGYFGVSISKELLLEMIEKIIKRFKS